MEVTLTKDKVVLAQLEIEDEVLPLWQESQSLDTEEEAAITMLGLFVFLLRPHFERAVVSVATQAAERTAKQTVDNVWKLGTVIEPKAGGASK